jgi:hypothetical protein
MAMSTPLKIERALYLSAMIFLLLSLQDGLVHTIGLWPPFAMAIVGAVTGVYLWPIFRPYRWETVPGLIVIGFTWGFTQLSPAGGREYLITTVGVLLAIMGVITMIRWWKFRGHQRQSGSH